MWDGFSLAGPGSVFFADFGGAAHPVRDSYSSADFPAGHCHADGGQCRSTCLLPVSVSVSVSVPVPVLCVADWLLHRGVVGLWF